jgi:hypothetical protein
VCSSRSGKTVAGLAGGDALFSDELPRARPVDHSHTTVLALSPDLHMTRQKEVHHRRGLALFDEVGAGRKPFDIDDIGRISERRRLAREKTDSARTKSVPDLAGFALGKRDHTDLGAGTRVLGEGAASAEGLVIGMGEDSQQTRRLPTGSVH